MPKQHVLNPVDGSGSQLGQPFPQRGQLTIPTLLALRREHPSHLVDGLAFQQPFSVDPQQLTQRVGVPAVGLLLGPLLGLDQHRLPATVFLQHFEQPIVEPANLQNRHKPSLRLRPLAEPREKRPHTLPFRAHLTLLEHVALLVADIHGQLLAVLVNCEVQHQWFSLE